MKNIQIAVIKTEANAYLQNNNCTHGVALKHIAIENGFENYHHAVNQNDKNSSFLRIITKWKDKNTEGSRSGQEYIDIALSQPPKIICNENELFQHTRRLSSFKYQNNNCLIYKRSPFESQDVARQYACYVARVFRFMDVTGLKPSINYNVGFPKRDERGYIENYDGFDHITHWLDPYTGINFFTTEPYPGQPVTAETEEKIYTYNSIHLIKMKKRSCGMHHIKRDGKQSTLFYIGGKNKEMLEKFANILNHFAAISEDNWSGLANRKFIRLVKSVGYFESVNNIDFLQNDSSINDELKSILINRINLAIEAVLKQTYYRKGIHNPILQLQKDFFGLRSSNLSIHDYQKSSTRKFFLKQVIPLYGYLVEIQECLATITPPDVFMKYSCLIKKAEKSIDKADWLMRLGSYPSKTEI